MINLQVEPTEIWPFKPDSGINLELIRRILGKGWMGIPPVPIFPAPFGNCKYILIDGHNRRNSAIYLAQMIPAALYQEGEVIDTERDGLASFRHSTDSRLYQKLLRAYELNHSLHSKLMEWIAVSH